MELKEIIDYLWKIADADECDGNCDLDPPYNACPECLAGRGLNELSEVAGGIVEEIKKAQLKAVE